MKAFMSATDRPLARMDAMFRSRRSPGERAIADLALTEVELILADTEPMRPGYRMADRMYLGPTIETWYGVRMPPDAAGLALADALEAFVAMDLDEDEDDDDGSGPEDADVDIDYRR
jgi:hypothetical protein